MMHERAQLFSIEALLSVEKPFLTIIYQTDDECTESIETASKYIRMALDIHVVCQNRRRGGNVSFRFHLIILGYDHLLQ